MYSYQPKGDHFTIFRDKKKIHTPKGNVITASTEAFAQRLVDELSADADYTSCASILCYHYTYLDLMAEYSQQQVAEDLLTCLDENVEYDPFIALDEEKAINKMTDEEADNLIKVFKQQFKAFIAKATMQQLVGITVIYCTSESLALPYHILHSKKAGQSTENLIDDLKAYCKREEMELPDNMPDIIDALVEYCDL